MHACVCVCVRAHACLHPAGTSHSMSDFLVARRDREGLTGHPPPGELTRTPGSGRSDPNTDPPNQVTPGLLSPSQQLCGEAANLDGIPGMGQASLEEASMGRHPRGAGMQLDTPRRLWNRLQGAGCTGGGSQGPWSQPEPQGEADVPVGKGQASSLCTQESAWPPARDAPMSRTWVRRRLCSSRGLRLQWGRQGAVELATWDGGHVGFPARCLKL